MRNLIVVSAAFRRDGSYPEILAQMEGLDEKAAEQVKQTDLYQTYRNIAPRPKASLCSTLGVMFRQDRNRVFREDPQVAARQHRRRFRPEVSYQHS